MTFCALNTDQHKALYKLIYKDVIDKNAFNLKDFTQDLYNKVFSKTKNQELALTYASYVPSYVSSLQAEDKDFRSVLKVSKADANEILDKIDEWENNLSPIAAYLQIQEEPSKAESPATQEQKVEAKRIVAEGVQTAKTREELSQVMQTIFNLPEEQAKAVAEIYDRTAGTYAERNNTTKEAFYDKLGFKTSTMGELLGSNAKFQIIGEKGAQKSTQILDKLTQAKQLESENIDSKEIYIKTGWEKSVENKWQYTLPTDNIKIDRSEFDKLQLKSDSIKLKDILKYPELYELYPGIENIPVKSSNDDAFRGKLTFEKYNKLSIEINKNVKGEQFQSTLIHEIQHAIQAVEGFGLYPQKKEDYASSNAEVEARNASIRSFIADEEKQFLPISLSEDVLRSKQRPSHPYNKSFQGNVETSTFDQEEKLLAPNGKPSKLNTEQHALVRTPEFKAWFGDWENDPKNASKIVDENGEPLVVYHSSESPDIEVFSSKKINPDLTKAAKGFYFSPRKSETGFYGDNVYPVFLNIREPFIGKEEWDSFTNDIQGDGYIYNFKSLSADTDIIAYKSNQIKSVDNIGTFDSTNDNIFNQKQGLVARGAAQIAEDGSAIIHALTSPNVSTPLHELAHVWEHQLNDIERKDVLNWTGQDDWNNSTSEQFAKGFEAYLANGYTPNQSLSDIFQLFKKWLTDIYKGIFGSQIDLHLNEDMQRIYTQMLGGDFRGEVMREINGEQMRLTKSQLIANQAQEETKLGSDYMKPIPTDSINYWSQLSAIQQAFINNKYDELLNNNKITEEQLREIVNSTKTLTESGLSPKLVDYVMFRHNNPELLDDTEFWQSKPNKESPEYYTLLKTVQDAVRNGAFEQAVRNDVITTKAANDILNYTLQISPAVTKAIKDKQKEKGEITEEVKEVKKKAKKEIPIEEKTKSVMDQMKEQVQGNGIYSQGLKAVETEEEFRDVMKAIAEQYNDPISKDGIVNTVGEAVAKKAHELYPDAKVEGSGDLAALLLKGDEEQQIQALPDAVDEPTPIKEGDIVSFKNQNYQVSEVLYGETPEDNMYKLEDGSVKFAEQITKVQGEDDYNVQKFQETDPNVFRILESEKGEEGELTNREAEKEADKIAFNYSGLKTLLERLKVKFGGNIDYEVISSDEDFKGRFKDGKVQINLKKYDITTPFHEYLHPFVEVLKTDNPTLYRNLVGEFANLDDSKTLVEDIKKSSYYQGSTAEEIGDEALVRYLADKMSKNVNNEGRRKEKAYRSAIERLVDNFRDWFSKLWSKLGGMVVTNLSNIPATASLNDIVDLVSLHDLTFDLSTRLDLVQTLEKYQAEDAPEQRTYEQKIIDAIKRKIPLLEHTAKVRLKDDTLLTPLIHTRQALKLPDETDSLMMYLRDGMLHLDKANSHFSTISNKLRVAEGNLSTEELKELSKDLENVKNIISFYTEAEQYFNYIGDDLSQDEYNLYARVLTKNKSTIGRMHSTSMDIVTEWLYPYVARVNDKIKDKYPEKVLTKDKFKESLRTANSDIDQAFFLLGSVSSSKDAFSAVLRNSLYDMVEENHLYETEMLENIKIGYDGFLKNTGLTNDIKSTTEHYKQNYLRKATISVQTGIDKETKDPMFEDQPHWAFHQEYHYDLFDKERRDFMTQIQFDETDPKKVEQVQKWEAQNSTNQVIGYREAYKDVLDANRNPVRDANNQIVKENVQEPIMKLVPAERFRNQVWTSLQNDEFFKTLSKNYDEANAKLGDQALKYGTVPQVSKGKNMFADYRDLSIPNKLKLFGKKTLATFLGDRAEESTDAKKVQNLDGSYYMNIHNFHSTLLKEEDLDLTLPETVVKFASANNLVSIKQDLNPLISVTKSLIEGNEKLAIPARKITQVTSDSKTIFDKVLKLPASKEKAKVRLNEQLTEFINDIMYGESSFEEVIQIFGKPVSLNNISDKWAFLTALNNMAFNINGAINNVAVGKAQLYIESTGGRYFNFKEYAVGAHEYNKALLSGTFIKDSFDLKKSKITQLGIKYDAIQGEFRDKYGKKFVGNIASRYANTDTIFILNHAAEHEIQLKGMLAMLQHVKVKDTQGNEMSLYDAHEINQDGYLRLKDDIQWSKQQEFDFINELHGVNKRLNGNYSSFDRVVMQRRWYGKLALIYRKYIYTSIRSRFVKEYTDYEVGKVEEGYQRKFFGKLYSDMKEYKFDMASRLFTGKIREGWNEDEKYAFNKTLSEYGFLAGAAILAAVIAGAESDDKDSSFAAKAILLYTMRFRNDMAFFTPFAAVDGDLNKILTTPSAIIQTMQKYGDFISQLVTGPADTYAKKTGAFQKGELKLKAKLFKAVPIVRQVVNFLSPEDQLAFYNLKPKKK